MKKGAKKKCAKQQKQQAGKLKKLSAAAAKAGFEGDDKAFIASLEAQLAAMKLA